MTMRVAVYARQSLDRSGEGLAVSRQVHECRELAERHGWEITEVYQDNDRSATTGKVRPEWKRLLADLDAGKHDVLVAWHTDRLYRRLRDLVDLVEIAQRRALRIATVKASDLDLSTPAGRMVASQLGSVAAYEGEQKAERQVTANRDRARRGIVLWTRRPYGFDREGQNVVIVEREAAEIRKAAARVLAGDTLTSIAHDLTRRRLKTSTGATWSATAVRRALINPRVAGRVVSKGEDYGRNSLAILDGATFDRVGAILRDPSRKSRPPSTEVKYLLSGIVRCGRQGCDDAKMWATTNASGRMIYRCVRCYGTRGLDDVDELVMGIITERVSRPDAVDLLTPDVDLDAIRARLTELRARRDALAALLGDGLLSESAVREQAVRLGRQIDDLEREQRDATGADPLSAVVHSGDVVAALDALDIRALRAVTNALLVVRILPLGKGFRFRPESVDIAWRVTA